MYPVHSGADRAVKEVGFWAQTGSFPVQYGQEGELRGCCSCCRLTGPCPLVVGRGAKEVGFWPQKNRFLVPSGALRAASGGGLLTADCQVPSPVMGKQGS